MYGGIGGYTKGLRDAGLGNAAMAGDMLTSASAGRIGFNNAYDDQLDRLYRQREAEDISRMTDIARLDHTMSVADSARIDAMGRQRAYDLDTPYVEEERRLAFEKARADSGDAVARYEANVLALESARRLNDDAKALRKRQDEFKQTAAFAAFDDIFDDGRASEQAVKALNEAFGTNAARIEMGEAEDGRAIIRAYDANGKVLPFTSRMQGRLAEYASVVARERGPEFVRVVAQNLPDDHRKNLMELLAEEEAIMTARARQRSAEADSQRETARRYEEQFARGTRLIEEAQAMRKSAKDRGEDLTADELEWVTGNERMGKFLRNQSLSILNDISPDFFNERGNFDPRRAEIKQTAQGGGVTTGSTPRTVNLYNAE